MQLAAPPKTPLERYRVLSPTASTRVSPLQLGGMSIGNKWGTQMGSMSKEDSFKLLDAFYESGGNFIDTANNYQDETSEIFIGEWVEKRGIRDQLVLATKYSTPYKLGDADVKQKISFIGNSAKSLQVSVNASLKKLRTDYIDILYLHWWDYETSIPEVMNALNNLVTQGKVVYLGVSDTPAWVVSRANQYARDHGMSQFVIYQGAWNVMDRSFERDIIPMARSEGMALAPWNVLCGGKLRTAEEEQRRKESGEKGRDFLLSGNWERTEDEVKMVDALQHVADQVGGKSVTAVALAYVMQKTPYVFPIVGGRKVEHLMANIQALEIVLTPEHIKYIESVFPFDAGFPNNFIGDGHEPFWFFPLTGTVDRMPLPEALRPSQ